MSNNVKSKKRLTQLIIALLVICLTGTCFSFIISSVVKDASAATYNPSVNSASTWNTAVNRSSGDVVNITLTGDITDTAKLNAIPSGVTVNLNMNGHSIYYDYKYSGSTVQNDVIQNSYPPNSNYWGLITNNGTLTISGTGTIRMLHAIVTNFKSSHSSHNNYCGKVSAIVNTGTLTIGSGVTVASYLDYACKDTTQTSDYEDVFVYAVTVYNTGTVNTSGTINTGSFSAPSSQGNYVGSGSNSYKYAFSYGIFGGIVNVTGGTIFSEAYAGAVASNSYCKQENHHCAYAIGVYSNNASITGDSNINTNSITWMDNDNGYDTWSSSGGRNISWSAGVMYSGENYPFIGASADINASFTLYANSTKVSMPGAPEYYFSNCKIDEKPSQYARRAYPVVGINASNNINYTIGLNTSEKNFTADGGYFGLGSTASDEYMDNDPNKYNNFNANMKYYAEDPHYDNLTGTTYLVNSYSESTDSYMKESGSGTHETKTASIKNGVPGTAGTQYVIVYRYFNGSRAAANLSKASYSYDSTIQGSRGYVNVAGNRAYKGIMVDADTNIAYGGGGNSKNSYYYSFEGTYIEKVATATYSRRNINTVSYWTTLGSTLTSAGTNMTTANTAVIYFDYVKKNPSQVRVATTDIGTTIGYTTTSTSFTSTYTGKSLIPGTDFNLGIIDMGSNLTSTTDDTVVTNVYNIEGSGSGSGGNATAVTYRYKGESEADTEYKDGLPKNVGKYVIEVAVKDDTTYAASGTYNRAGTTAYINCEIKKADVTITGDTSKTGTYGDNLASLVPTNSYTITGKNGEAPAGTWSYAGDYKSTDYLNAGSYNLTLVWTPVAGSDWEKNYNSATLGVTLVVNKREVTVNMGATSVEYGSDAAQWVLEYTNLAACDNEKATTWTKNTVGSIYYNSEWVGYTSEVQKGDYRAIIASFGGDGDGNNTFTKNTKEGSLHVGNAVLHYEAKATSRAYEPGNKEVDVTLTYVSGAKNNDSVSETLTTKGTMNNANAGENKSVTVTKPTEYAGSSNYDIQIDNNCTVNITKATPGGGSCVPSDSTLVYDSTRTLSSISLTAAGAGVAGSWQWVDSSIVPTCDVSEYTAIFVPSDKTNYYSTYEDYLNGKDENGNTSCVTEVPINVTKKEVMVSIAAKTVTYGDPIPALTSFKYVGFTGTDSIDTVPTTGEISASTTYTRGTGVGTYPVTVTSTLGATNYSFTPVNTSITVNKKDLTIKTKDASITYGDASPTFTETDLTTTGFYGSDSLSSLDSVYARIYASGYSTGSDAGTYPIVVEGYKSDNYNITFEYGTLTVNKKALTVKPTAQTITYGQAIPLYKENGLYTITGFVLNDTKDNTDITNYPSFTTSYTAGKNVGEYAVTPDVSSMTATNYSFKAEDGVLTVNQATPNLSRFPTATVYHSQSYAEAVVTGGEATNPNNGEEVAGTFTLKDASKTADCTNDSYPDETFVFTPEDELNYTTAECVNGITILKKPITGVPIITGSPMEGETLTASLSAMDPTDTSVYSYQWYRGDTQIPGATSATYAVTSSDIGSTLKVIVTAKSDTGYIGSASSDPTSQVIKALTIPTAAQLDITIPENSVYDGNARVATATVKSGLENNVGNVTVKYNGSTTAPKNAGTYTVTVDIATPQHIIDNPNSATEQDYGPVSGLEIGKFTIEKADYNVVVNAEDKIYDGTRKATAALDESGAVEGDDVALASGYTFTFADARVGSEKTVTVSGLSLTGADAANYKLAITYGTADITPATLYARADGVTKVYDGSSAVEVTFSNISGYVGSDGPNTVYFVSGTATAASPNAGRQILSNITYQLAGSSAGNYIVSVTNQSSATVMITQAEPTVTAPTIDGLVYNSARTLESVSLSAYGSNDGSWEFDDKTIVPTVEQKLYAATYYPTSSNYKPYNAMVTINVIPATVTIRAEDKIIPYGSAVPTTTLKATGFTGSDTLADMGGRVIVNNSYYQGQPVGQYEYELSSALDNSNYNFVIASDPGTIIVVPAQLVVTATAVDKVYDGNTDITVNFSITSGKYVNDDVALSTASTTGTASSANAGPVTVQYTKPTLTGDAKDNYEVIVAPASGVLTAEIKKADIQGVIFPTAATVEFGRDLSYAKFETEGTGAGTFAYENAKSVIPDKLGVFNNYKVIFTPTDSRNYNTKEANVKLTVVKGKLDYVVGVAGTPQSGQRLTAVITGMPSLANDYIQYQWYRSSETEVIKIEGATSSVYTATEDDIGYTLIVVTTFPTSAPYEFSDTADTVEIDAGVVGIIGQSNKAIEAVKLSFWQRLMNWIYRIIAAITGIRITPKG